MLIDAPTAVLGGSLGLIIILVFGVFGLYFLPAILGFRKRNRLAIFAMNLLLGWIGVGWVRL